MPVFGGTTRKLSSACWPHLRNSYRSWFRSNSRSRLIVSASARPKASVCTEWSMTSSTGCSGLIRVGSPPSAAIASRIAARSTTHGTPVKSCRITRATVNAISLLGSAFASHPASASTSPLNTLPPPSFRSRFSSRMRSE